MTQSVCAWCQTVNPANGETCLACGGPLERSRPAEIESVKPLQPDAFVAVAAPQTLPGLDAENLVKTGQHVEEIYTGALNMYAGLWRTLGEALAIGVSAFLFGLIGGVTGMPAAAIFAGLLLGVVVGLVSKGFYWIVLGAPLGTLVGAAVWLAPWFLGAGPGGMLLSALVFGVLGAALGGRWSFGDSGWWGKLRPILGGLGGIFFAGLGLLLGWGIAQLTAGLLRAIQG